MDDDAGKPATEGAFLAAYATDLTADERKLLRGVATRFVDEAFMAIEIYADWRKDARERDRIGLFRNTFIAAYHPDRFANRHGPLFIRKYAVALVSVGLKMAVGDSISLASTAEELVFHGILEAAKTEVETGEAGDCDEERLEDFAGLVYEDTDFM